MARYSMTTTSVTPIATADGVNLANLSYLGVMQGGSTTQRLKLSEIYMGGEAPAISSPTLMVLARDTVAAGTLVAGGTRNALLDASASPPASVPVTGNSATVLPQRSTLLHLLHLTFNAYGGIVRWKPSANEDVTAVGNTQPLGELSLSAFTGGVPGPISSHVLYEAV